MITSPFSTFKLQNFPRSDIQGSSISGNKSTLTALCRITRRTSYKHSLANCKIKNFLINITCLLSKSLQLKMNFKTRKTRLLAKPF